MPRQAGFFIFRQVCFFAVVVGLSAACGPGHKAISDHHELSLTETALQELKLPPGFDGPDFEYSGMAWLSEEQLLLLPQFPAKFENQAVVVTRASIERCLGKKEPDCFVAAKWLPMNLPAQLPEGYQGFEAVSVLEEQIFMTVETASKNAASVLYRARLEEGVLVIDPSSQLPLQGLDHTPNMGFEALTQSLSHEVLALYERREIDQAADLLIGQNLVTKITVDPLEFRVTDATEMDRHGRFWVSNYQWEQSPWRSEKTPLSDRFHAPLSYGKRLGVERFVELHFDGEQVVMSSRPPVYLLLERHHTRNWEGIARYKKGILVVTDKFPRTVFGFVPLYTTDA